MDYPGMTATTTMRLSGQRSAIAGRRDAPRNKDAPLCTPATIRLRKPRKRQSGFSHTSRVRVARIVDRERSAAGLVFDR